MAVKLLDKSEWTKDGRKWDNNYVIYDDTDTKTIIKNLTTFKQLIVLVFIFLSPPF